MHYQHTYRVLMKRLSRSVVTQLAMRDSFGLKETVVTEIKCAVERKVFPKE